MFTLILTSLILTAYLSFKKLPLPGFRHAVVPVLLLLQCFIGFSGWLLSSSTINNMPVWTGVLWFWLQQNLEFLDPVLQYLKKNFQLKANLVLEVWITAVLCGVYLLVRTVFLGIYALWRKILKKPYRVNFPRSNILAMPILLLCIIALAIFWITALNTSFSLMIAPFDNIIVIGSLLILMEIASYFLPYAKASLSSDTSKVVGQNISIQAVNNVSELFALYKDKLKKAICFAHQLTPKPSMILANKKHQGPLHANLSSDTIEKIDQVLVTDIHKDLLFNEQATLAHWIFILRSLIQSQAQGERSLLVMPEPELAPFEAKMKILANQFRLNLIGKLTVITDQNRTALQADTLFVSPCNLHLLIDASLEVDTVIIFNLHKLDAQTLFAQIRRLEIRNPKLRYRIFSDDYIDIKTAIDQVRGTEIEQATLLTRNNQSWFQIVLDSTQLEEHRFGYLSTQITGVIPSARLAHENGHKVLYFGNQFNQLQQRKLQQQFPAAIGQIESATSFLEIDEDVSVVLMDDNYNLYEQTQRQVNPYHSDVLTVLLLNRQYLLRDFMLAIAEVNRANGISVEFIRHIMPPFLGGPYDLTMQLLSELSSPSGLEKKRLEVLLERYVEPTFLSKNHIHASRPGLLRLFRKTLADLPQIHVNEQQCGMSINFTLRADIPASALPYMTVFLESGGKQIGQLPAYQYGFTFVEGTGITLNNTPYYIKEVDENKGIVIATLREEINYHSSIYAFRRRYTIRDLVPEKPPTQVSIGELTIKSQPFTGSFVRKTDSWIKTNTPNAPLRSWETGKLAKTVTYSRKYANILKITIRHPELKGCQKALSTTLCALVQDALPSIFENAIDNLVVGSVHNEDFHNHSERLDYIYPAFIQHIVQKNNTQSLPEDCIELLILEDSQTSFGLASYGADVGKVKDKILHLILGYLQWSGQSDKPLYHQFNNDKLPPCFDYAKAECILSPLDDGIWSTILNPTPLSETRLTHDGHSCDFCGAPVPAKHWQTSDDCRKICDACKQTSVLDLKHLNRLIEEVHVAMQRRFQLSLPLPSETRFASAKEIATTMGKPLDLKSRAVGVAILLQPGICIMLIENAAPEEEVKLTLAHELVHIWQYNQLPQNTKMGERLTQTMEGQARYVEIDMARHAFGLHKQADVMTGLSQNQDDIYAKGIRELWQEFGMEIPPANLFNCFEKALKAKSN